MGLKVSDVNLEQTYQYAGVAISEGKVVDAAFREGDPGKFADKVNHFHDCENWTPEAKRQAVDLLMRGDRNDKDIRAALLKILSTMRDGKELELVFPDNGARLDSFLSGSKEQQRAGEIVDDIGSRSAAGRATDADEVVARLETSADALETILEMLDDSAVPQEIKDALIEHYGQPQEIRKAVDYFRKWARAAEHIDLQTELDQIGGQLKSAESLIEDGERVLARAERAYERSGGSYERADYGTKDAGETSNEDRLLGLAPESLLAMLDRGDLKAADLTPAVQLKIQREMNQQSMLQSLYSNLLNVRHEMAMVAIRNIKA